MRAAVAGSAVFTVAAAVGLTGNTAAEVVAVVIDLVLFAIGAVAMLAALARAAQRSRTDEIDVATLFFLLGDVAPTREKRILLGTTVAQAAIAIATAAVNNALAFGILVPVYGFGLIGLWASRNGRFPPRKVAGRRRPAPSRQGQAHRG